MCPNGEMESPIFEKAYHPDKVAAGDKMWEREASAATLVRETWALGISEPIVWIMMSSHHDCKPAHTGTSSAVHYQAVLLEGMSTQ
jgi:hypothetical protein